MPMGKLEKIQYLTKRVIEVLRSDIKFGVGLIGKMITSIVMILFNTYMLLWITRFVDSGLLQSEDESKIVYQRIIVVSVILGMFAVPIIGFLVDKLPARFTISASFALRCLTGIGFT